MVKKLIDQLVKALDLPIVEENKEKIYKLVLTPDISFILMDKEKEIFFSAELCPCPKENREDLFILLMKANFLGQGTKRSVLGATSDEKLLTLSYTMPYESTYQEFRDAVEDFANYLVYWREEIQAMEEKTDKTFIKGKLKNMPMHLMAEEGPLKGKILRFAGKEEFIIGRDPEQADLILDDPTVSRKHVRCMKEKQNLIIEDLSRTNPILLNDQALVGEHILQEGDRIRIGQNVFLFSKKEIPATEEEIEEQPQSSEDLGAETVFLDEQNDKDETPYDTIFEDLQTTPQKEEKLEAEKPSIPKEETTTYDTIFEDLEETSHPESSLEEPKLYLKVLTGPNMGAEFALEKNKTYLLGKDTNTCDIIFNDLSVSRHHASLTIDDKKTLTLEDLGSKNKTYINSRPVEGKNLITSQDLVTMGTTTFVVVDRDIESETIYTPSMPEPEEEVFPETREEKIEEKKETPGVWKKEQIIPYKHLIFAAALGLFLLVSVLSFFSLFKPHTIEVATKDVTKDISKALSKYPDITFSYNPRSENIFLMGHVMTTIEKQQLMHDLSQLSSVASVEDKVIIDELVWQSINGILSDNPNWRSVAVHSIKPGRFIVSGYLQTTKESEALADYLNINFPYVDRLDNKVVVQDILDAEVSSLLRKQGFEAVSFGISNGDVILTGQYDEAHQKKFTDLLEKLKTLAGVKQITNLVIAGNADTARIDLSQNYAISGFATVDGTNTTVVINGKILAIGDLLDGMKIQSIKENIILLEKDQVKYKINYSQASQ